MLQWMSGYTKIIILRNTIIREKIVVALALMLEKSRL